MRLFLGVVFAYLMMMSLIVVLTIAVIGMFIIIVGVGLIVVFLYEQIPIAIKVRNWGGLAAFVAVIVGLTLLPYLAMLLAVHGGFFAADFVQTGFDYEKDGIPASEAFFKGVAVLFMGGYAFLGWIIPLIFGIKALDSNRALNGEESTKALVMVAGSAGAWALLGGSVWAAMIFSTNVS